jgi:YfiH family protein
LEIFTYRTVSDVKYGYFPFLEEKGILNAFTCREGGESDICPGGLNMALHVGDDVDKVIHNREKAADAIGFSLDSVVTCAQVHGSNIAIVDSTDAGKGAYSMDTTIADTDGLVTADSSLPLMLFFADCTPVVLADFRNGVLSLVHAGWRGTVAQIAPKALKLMQHRFGTNPADVIAAIGPSIGPCCYEVGDNVYQAAEGYAGCFTATRPGHYQMDLWKMNREELLRGGVPSGQILTAGVCTADSPDYFSYRAEKGYTGRLAAIVMRK